MFISNVYILQSYNAIILIIELVLICNLPSKFINETGLLVMQTRKRIDLLEHGVLSKTGLLVTQTSQRIDSLEHRIVSETGLLVMQTH